MQRFLWAFVAALILLSFAVAAFGQDAPPAPPQPFPDLPTTLEKIHYDDRNGPLLTVMKGMSLVRYGGRGVAAPGVTNLNETAAFFHLKMMRAGGVTVLAPPEMTLINQRPAKARAFANIRQYDALKIFIGSLTPSQWKRIGGPGIALGDLNDRQKQIFDAFLPQNPVLRRPRPPSEAGQSYPFFEVPADYEELDRNQIRLRFTRRVNFSFLRVDKPKEGYSGDSPQISGTMARYAPSLAERDTGQGPDVNGEWRNDRAFGSPLLLRTPNRLKPSHIDYAASLWASPVSLSDGGDAKRVDDLLKRISAATGREILADARVGGLSVAIRAAPDSAVRAGDLLQALALCVTGAYRQMAENTFLLTDDIDGIGTRFARLNSWAEQAESERNRVEFDQAAKYERPDFVAVLRPAPNDPLAVSDEMYRAIQAKANAGESEREGLEVSVASLPTEVQLNVRAQGERLEKQQEPIAVRTDRVRLHTALASEWVLPDGTVTYAMDKDSLTYAESGVFDYYPPSRRRKAAVKAAASPIKPLPPELKRRILLCNPATPAEAEKYAALAKERGLTELWIVVSLDKCDVRPLKAALAAGKQRKTLVYAVLPLFRDCGVGEPDRNILGETGEEFGARRNAEMKESDDPEQLREYADGMAHNWKLYAGWRSVGESELPDLLHRVQLVARVPGLAGLALTDSGGPNYTGKRENIEEIYSGGRLGYAARSRLAFLRAGGADPADIADEISTPAFYGRQVELPFFPNRWFTRGSRGFQQTEQEPASKWQEFLYNENRALLAKLYASLRADLPTLPLYLDDRASRYGGGNYAYFGSWDSPERLPQNPIWGHARDAAPAARRVSQTVLLLTEEYPHTARPRTPADFSRDLGDAGANAMKGWDGLIVDMSALPAAEAARLFTGK